MAANPELEARILADRADRGAYLVYADWLAERGDPRGELVVVQTRLEGARGDAALCAREAGLLAEHRRAWLGALAACGDDELGCTWHRGFVTALRIGPEPEVARTTALDLAAIVAELARLPHTGLVRELVLGGLPQARSWTPVLEAIARHGLPAGLVRLELHHGRTAAEAQTDLGVLAIANERLAPLRELRVALATVELAGLELPALRALELATAALTPPHVAALRATRWPALERLSVRHAAQLATLEPLLDAHGMPRLRHFAYEGALSDALAARLPDTPLLAQLGTLALSPTEAGARALLAHGHAYAHLTQIDLSRGRLSAVTRARLAAELWPRVT